jgi:hypothetical protein
VNIFSTLPNQILLFAFVELFVSVVLCVVLRVSIFFGITESNTALSIRSIIYLCCVALEYFFVTTESNTALYPRPINNTDLTKVC